MTTLHDYDDRLDEVKPAQRVDVITRCAQTLALRSWADIDFILGQFDLPTQNEWDDSTNDSQFNYVRFMLGKGHAADVDLLALDDYLHGLPTHDEAQEPWDSGTACRVFISHLATERVSATAIQTELRFWGLDGFVAHKDIDPGAEWIRVIVAALHSCHALVALLHTGFKESSWCDQEVGVAFGRAIPVIPVRIKVDPYGLLGMYQAVSWPVNSTPEAYVAREVVKILLSDKRTSERVAEAFVSRLEHASSYDQANQLSTALAESSVSLDVEQLGRLRSAQKRNRQVTEAYLVEDALMRLEGRLPHSVKASLSPPVSRYDDEPF